MRHNIFWITFWTTMAYWLAGAWGCAAQPVGGERAAATLLPTNGGAEPTTVPATDAVASGPTMGPTTAPALRSETQPSLQGLDRSNWPKVVVTTGDARVTHFPIYFQDFQIGGGHARAFAEQSDVPAQMKRALAPARAGGWRDANNAIDAAIGPVKFPLDLLMLPVNMFQQKPWKTTTP